MSLSTISGSGGVAVNGSNQADFEGSKYPFYLPFSRLEVFKSRKQKKLAAGLRRQDRRPLPMDWTDHHTQRPAAFVMTNTRSPRLGTRASHN
jgi:hypothetical protein